MDSFKEYIDKNIPKFDTFHPTYNEAIEYIIKTHGKLFRPQLLLSIVKEYQPLLVESAYQVAFALELFHTYSLIHDDLPAMDNAHLRRGNKTLHILHNEALAILIGDAFNTYAFELISTSAFRDDVKVELIKTLSKNGGINGMVLGQAIDLEFENKPLKLEEVEILHTNKTAKLIAASLKMGAIIVDLPKDTIERLYNFGIRIGILFQVQDDILDETSSQEEQGKPTKHDKDKNSFINIIGLEKSIEYANNLAKEIEDELNSFEPKLKKALNSVVKKYIYRHKV